MVTPLGFTPAFGWRPSDANTVAFAPYTTLDQDGRRPRRQTSDLRSMVEIAEIIGPAKGEPCVRDQGPSSSCVAHACSMGWRTRLAAMAGGDEKKLAHIDLPSLLVGYLGARRRSGDASWDSGTMIQAWFDYVMALGLPPEHMAALGLAFDPNRVLEHLQPDGVACCDRADVQRAANDFKLLDGVNRLDAGLSGTDLLEAVDECLSNDEPVVFGVPLDVDFARLEPGKTYERKKPVIGKHAMLLIGHDKSRYRLVNSWSKLWCDQGFGLIDKAWFLEEAQDIHRFGLVEPWQDAA